MIRRDDVIAYTTITKFQSLLADFKADINYTLQFETQSLIRQPNITKDEYRYTECLRDVQMSVDILTAAMKSTLQVMDSLQEDRKYEFLIGVGNIHYNDQQFLRDQDEWIEATCEAEAIGLWYEKHHAFMAARGWFRKQVKVFDYSRVGVREEIEHE